MAKYGTRSIVVLYVHKQTDPMAARANPILVCNEDFDSWILVEKPLQKENIHDEGNIFRVRNVSQGDDQP